MLHQRQLLKIHAKIGDEGDGRHDDDANDPTVLFEGEVRSVGGTRGTAAGGWSGGRNNGGRQPEGTTAFGRAGMNVGIVANVVGVVRASGPVVHVGGQVGVGIPSIIKHWEEESRCRDERQWVCVVRANKGGGFICACR